MPLIETVSRNATSCARPINGDGARIVLSIRRSSGWPQSSTRHVLADTSPCS